MNNIFYSIFISLSFRMTVITLFVILIKNVFKAKLSAKMHCLIWLIPYIQLIFCLGRIKIKTNTSIYNIMPSISDSTEAVKSIAVVTKTIDPRNIITAVWIIGAIIIALWYLSVFLIYKRKVGKYTIIDDEDIIKNSEVARCVLKISSSEKIVLRFGDTAQTMPHLVILPHDYTSVEIHQILLHELCHYRHHDYAKLWSGLLMLCINWFNPIMWYAFKLFCTDIEMLCDDRVLKITNSKKEYARTLVKSAMMKNRFVPGAASVHNGKNEVKRRVKRIASLKKIKPAWKIVTICVCVAVSCICLTDAVSTAVENTVDVTSTPEPAAVIPTAVPAAVPTAQPVVSQVPAKTQTNNVTRPVPTDTSYSDNSYNSSNDFSYTDESQEVGNISVYPPAERETASDIQTSNIEAYLEETTSDEVSNIDVENGNKSTYELDDGRTVILQYDGDTVAVGYILNN